MHFQISLALICSLLIITGPTLLATR